MTSDPGGQNPFTGASDIGQMERTSWPPTQPIPAVRPEPVVTASPDAVTVTWPATGLTTVMPEQPGDCRCGMCPGSTEPQPGPALLSYAPGVTARMHDTRVRCGQWEDIPAYCDDAWTRVHRPARKTRRDIGRDLSNGFGHVSLVLGRHPEWRQDAELAAGFAAYEAGMAARLAELREWIAKRAEETRAEVKWEDAA